MTLKELIDVIDEDRSSRDELIHIIDDEHGNITAPTSNPIWDKMQSREVEAIEAAATWEINVWLKEEEDK